MATTQEVILIEKCRLGETGAFKPLIQLYRRQLFSYLYRLSGNREEAEDLFQDVLIKVWKGLKSYNDKQKFASWLFTIAHNTAMDSFRKLKNTYAQAEVEPDNLAGINNPYKQLIESELKKKINLIVESLPVKQREVFLLRTEGGFTFKEIAVITKEPLNTVLSHMNYALKKIRKYFGDKDERSE